MNKKTILIPIFAILIGCFSQVTFAATVHEIVPSSRVITRVIPGMTVNDIIHKIYPQEKKLWTEIKEKLIDINPDSFHPYSDKLVTGSRLNLVDIKRIHQEEVSSKRKVGYIVRQEGKASVKGLNGDVQELEINSQIYEGDRITTAKAANLYILMDDGAEIYLKSDSVIKISEYVITSDTNSGGSSILDLIRGGLRKITGAIGASALSNYRVQTGLATIGIRGTEYVIKLCKHDDCSQAVGRNDSDAKLHAVVLEGIITLTTEEETQILMAIGEYGTANGEELLIEEDVSIPVGMLSEEESTRFNVTIPKQQMEEKQAEEESGGNWVWLLGLLLFL
ncbi:MAG: FecR domain-containing protein [Gammaproteobacteria bacterium]|nr:FecR domain-containing protein [Gammaproteobacteria bacterium]